MVLVYAESPDGQLKKTVFETVTYGKKAAEAMGTDCAALVLGNVENPAQLGQYGASAVHHINGDFDQFDSQLCATAIAEAAKKLGATTVILNHSSTGKSLLGRLAVKLNAGSVAGVNTVPVVDGDTIKVKKNVFSGKAIAEYTVSSPVRVLSLAGNSLKPEATGADVAASPMEVALPARKTTVTEINKQQGGTAPLPIAELVVSAGRGMKGPENWGIIEELAKELGATTACSRPVADTGWRPHHEHVGQTGVAIRPNLYIAAGISGAIQHLAGVNSSKCIVVINKDPEAPFFKAATYGICGDLFEVVPRLTEALRKAKN